MKFDLFWVQWYFWVLQHCGEIKKISICFCTGPDNFWPAPWQGDGRTFHTECLKSDDCGANVAGGAVFTRGDHILCGQCGGTEVSNKLILKITSRIVNNKCMYLLGSSEYLHNLLNHSRSGRDKSISGASRGVRKMRRKDRWRLSSLRGYTLSSPLYEGWSHWWLGAEKWALL